MIRKIGRYIVAGIVAAIGYVILWSMPEGSPKTNRGED